MKDVEEAQQKIVAVIRKIEDSGDIVISRKVSSMSMLVVSGVMIGYICSAVGVVGDADSLYSMMKNMIMDIISRQYYGDIES